MSAHRLKATRGEAPCEQAVEVHAAFGPSGKLPVPRIGVLNGPRNNAPVQVLDNIIIETSASVGKFGHSEIGVTRRGGVSAYGRKARILREHDAVNSRRVGFGHLVLSARRQGEQGCEKKNISADHVSSPVVGFT
jgi:hypothetical protein